MPRGGKREGAGRKPEENRENVKSVLITLKVTPSQKEQLKKKAEEKGISVAQLLLSVLD